MADDLVSLIDTRLYLPKSWTDDTAKCDEAGIPKERQIFKKKTELALEIIKAHQASGIRFDWINADGLYRNDLMLLNELEKLNELYLIDIHSSKSVYLEPFVSEIKEKKQGSRGRGSTRVLPNKK